MSLRLLIIYKILYADDEMMFADVYVCMKIHTQKYFQHLYF